MKLNYKLGRLAGIDVYVHVTFLALLGWIGLSRLFAGEGMLGAVVGVTLMVMLFGIVVLHELGHALAARRYGIPTVDITLYPIGGVARLARMPSKPVQELVVALAGPAVNLALAALFALGLVFAPPSPLLASLLYWLVGANVVLLAFNLLPAFPMDGGRVLRALLATRVGRLKATETAARVGRWMALLLGAAGLFYNPMLILIALFVWFSGTAELRAVQAAEAPPPAWGPRVVFVPGRGFVLMNVVPPAEHVRVVDVR